MKSLKTLQKLAKAGRIISKILYIFCIVGFCGCILGAVSFALLGDNGLKLGGISVQALIKRETGVSIASLYAAVITGAVVCAAEGFLCKKAEIYFSNELADGTPFTFRGADELKKLGILAIVVPLAVGLVLAIGLAVAAHFVPDVSEFKLEGFSAIGVGVALLITSVFCRWGAEREEADGKPAIPENAADDLSK